MMIIYAIALILFSLFAPLVVINPINNADPTTIFLRFKYGQEGLTRNGYFMVFSTVYLLSLAILITRNVSYRFRNFFNMLLGLRHNEYLLNLGLMWVLTTNFFTVGETVRMLKNEFSYEISLSLGYLILTFLLIIGVLIALYFALKQAKILKSTHVVHLAQDEDQEDKKHQELKELKGLFDHQGKHGHSHQEDVE